MSQQIPKLEQVLTERFWFFTDHEKLAYLVKSLYPNRANEYLEAIFGLETGVIEKVTSSDG